MNNNGNFTLALKQLSEKALHTLYSMRRRFNIHQLNPKSAIKIFDQIISPILLYNSEVWGAYIKNDFNNWNKLHIEKVHLRFCKLYLGVGKKASNITSRGELGKIPLIINIFKRLFKYITHLNSLKAFNLNTEITDLESTTTELIQPITKCLKENYLTFWKHKLENSSKTNLLFNHQDRLRTRKVLIYNKRLKQKENLNSTQIK
jgi:hypothetical protein